jgi:hypothetical protein
VWKASGLDIHALDNDRYRAVSRSALFPDLDVGSLTSYLQYPTVTQAVAAFRDTLR